MPEITFSTGVIEVPVNGKRNIRFNPSDIGFLDTLYSMVAKVEEIEKEDKKKRNKTEDPAKIFEYYRSSDKRMKDVVDSVFGTGFCDDVFEGVRLVAMADGLMVIEAFAFSVIDQMDESVRANMEARNAKIQKYTEKYKARKA